MTSSLAIQVRETTGIFRSDMPLSRGVPFPRGWLREPSALAVFDGQNQTAIPWAATPLAQWPDGSVKWMLFDFQLTLEPHQHKTIAIQIKEPADPVTGFAEKPLVLEQSAEGAVVRTGPCAFHLSSRAFLPFAQIYFRQRPLLDPKGSTLRLLNESGKARVPDIEQWRIDHQTRLRLSLAFEGKIGDTGLYYQCGLTFFAGKPFCRMAFTLKNPAAARHPGGTWDLGDPHSVRFHDLSLICPLAEASHAGKYSLEPVDSPLPFDGRLLIYQDSSGGENWQSRNHVNHQGRIPVSFPGFVVRNKQKIVARGDRAAPWLAAEGKNGAMAVGISHFWQNFPKSLELSDNRLIAGIFPGYFDDRFELQPGEEKTHTLWINAGEELCQSGLDFIHAPLAFHIPPDWYYQTGAAPRPVPWERAKADGYFSQYQDLVDIAVFGPNSFFDRRETIDEYGWRNFGDIYADHESVFHTGPDIFISHYNNQYDVIKGALVQFMRTGEADWFRLAHELAGHVADIDIYHTQSDRYEFNQGMFWHTDHHLDAATCTHRSVSRKHREFKPPHQVGGGPAFSHNYATGLLYHYWMTGEPRSRESVRSLAEYMRRGVQGPDTLLERGLKSARESAKRILKLLGGMPAGEFDAVYQFDGPGRASGNALNTLMDGYRIGKDKRYLACAEQLIGQCISPKDDIEARDLLNAELRWLYNVFLQALGRYLDLKIEMGQQDSAFEYARQSLLAYAAWMVENEYPYLDKPEILEFPNETWAGQEIRKADVLAHAAVYAPEADREKLMEKSRYFFQVCIDYLLGHETRTYTRPIVLLMCFGMVHTDIFLQWESSKRLAPAPPVVPGRPAIGPSRAARWRERWQRFSLEDEIQWLRRYLKQRLR